MINGKNIILLVSFAIIFYSGIISNKKLPKFFKSCLDNQFIKLILLIILFNLITFDYKLGLLFTIAFLITHNKLSNIMIDNNII
jgi:fumarate reductase subunit C